MVSRVSPLGLFGRDDIDVAGGKGANLGELVRAGLPVPDGFVVTTAAYQAFVADNSLQDAILGLAARISGNGSTGNGPAGDHATVSAQIRDLIVGGAVDPDLREAISAAYDALGGGPVAVRSSATAEDLVDASFAGQQDTYLNVLGVDALVDAVRRCWASLWTERAVAYRARQGVDSAQVSLAVVVQRLVDAEAAGVMFTANPGNGRGGEVLISAAWGLGESVVSGAVNTDDLVVAKADGRVTSRQVADKAVMTVRVDGGTAEQPVPTEQRRRSVLDDTAAAELARLGVRIEEHFGAPQDIEWVRSDGSFAIVQSRPITALPPAEADPPTDWTVPTGGSFYFRASIVEQLPDPLSPLFADLLDGSVTRSLTSLMTELLGPGAVRPGELGMPTVNGYAYYRYASAALLRMTLLTPKVLAVLAGSGRGSGLARWRDHSRPRYAATVATWTGRPLEPRSDRELADGVSRLLDAATEYYTAVQTIIPIAASSEVLFTWFYRALVRRPGDPPATTYLLGLDSLPILAEKSLYDLARWVRTDPDLAQQLLQLPVSQTVARLQQGRPDDEPGWTELAARLQAHLESYGHTVYNLDFVNAVPADDPAPLVDTLRFYLRDQGTDPYVRQQGSVSRREGATATVLARLDPVRGWVFSRLLRWAQGIAPERENALADVGLAWPQLRRMLALLGRRAVDRGLVAAPEDVFWLHWNELLDHGSTDGDPGEPTDLSAVVEERRQLWRARRRVRPPQLLPLGTWLDRLERLMPASSGNETGDVLTGVGASAGRVTATARVLDGPADFARLQAGEILVAAMTSPAWTSLFARAAGVVTDVGGPLSHSSIVAREYGIPAVLGTGSGTRRIHDGQRVTVDGDAGTVTLLEVAEVADVPEPGRGQVSD